MQRYYARTARYAGDTVVNVTVTARNYTDAYVQIYKNLDEDTGIFKLYCFSRRKLYGRKKNCCRA